MATCPNCQKEMVDGASFCTACGTKIGAVIPNAGINKLHCPSCKSHNISITTESSVNGAVSTHHGSFSSTHVSNTHRNYWVCHDCGTKFRNIQNLEEEIKKCKSTPTCMFVFAAIAAVLFLYLLIQWLDANIFASMFLGVWTFGSAIAAIIFFCLGFHYKKKFREMVDELAFLKINCFN